MMRSSCVAVDSAGLLLVGTVEARQRVFFDDIRAVICLMTANELSPVDRLPVDDVEEHWFPLSDDENVDDLASVLAQALPLIHQNINADRRVLVHCNAGVSRSVAVVTAYLIKYHGQTLEDALATIRRVRPMANPNPGYRLTLKRFEDNQILS